jgi:hypothetical protein
MALKLHDYGRDKIDFGLTEADLGPRIPPNVARAARAADFPALPAQRSS